MNDNADTNPKADRQIYFLITGEIVFQMKGVETPSAIRINAISMSSDGRIALNQIGRIQKQIQMNFHQKMQDPTIEILDVVLLNITPLGHFTAEEFNLRPSELAAMQIPPGAPVQ